MWWSWALSAIGLISLYQITKLDRKGFITGLGVEALWLWYAFETQQWGFLPAAFVYAWFYWRGWRKWGKISTKLDHIEEETVEFKAHNCEDHMEADENHEFCTVCYAEPDVTEEEGT